MNDTIRDLIIIGSGPAGYTAALYAARANLVPLVFEGSVTSGGALMTTTDVENFPGFPEGVTGPELMQKMRLQTAKFGVDFVANDVSAVDLAGEFKSVTDIDGETHVARSVILAMGSEYRRLGLGGEDRLSGRGVSWCATCDGAFFRDQQIAVVGGGDSALEEAMFLTRFASKVTVIHRRDELRASRVMVDRAMSNSDIEFLWNHEVFDILGEDRVDGLHLKHTESGADHRLAVTGLFIAVGHTPRSDLVRDQVDLDDEGYVRVKGGSTFTNIDGVFAAGDLVDRTYRQAITAAGSGCAAALDAERYLSEKGSQSKNRSQRTGQPAIRDGRSIETNGIIPSTGSRVRTVTELNFQTEVLESELPVLVDFWAEWCGPCRLVLPVLDQVAGEVSDRLVVAKLNVDENPATAAEYSVTSLPTMKIYRSGVVVHTIAGAKPKSKLLAELAAFL